MPGSLIRPFQPVTVRGFSKVHPHHDEQIAVVAVADFPELARVLERGPGVVHRARPGDHEQAVIVAVEDGADLAPAVLHGGRGLVGQRQLIEQGRRGSSGS